MKKGVIATALVLACSCAQAGERLNGSELKSFYTGKTMTGENMKLGPGRTYYGDDGSVISKSDSGTERVGKWWIDESANKRCIRWNNKKKDFCHYTERNSDGTHSLIHFKNGKVLAIMKSSQDGNQL
ncbi:MAG: hypothetical protein ABW085_13905 [Sedimenticola sp.]